MEEDELEEERKSPAAGEGGVGSDKEESDEVVASSSRLEFSKQLTVAV